MSAAATTHRCPADGCPKQVADHMLMCARHWRMVPASLQRELYRAWSRGLGAGTEVHAMAMRRCIDAVKGKQVAESPRLTPQPGKCRACGAAMLWATMPSGRANPLNIAEVLAEVGKGVTAFNPQTGKGIPVTSAVIDDCARWAEQGVTFHSSHFSDCPRRGEFRGPAEASA